MEGQLAKRRCLCSSDVENDFCELIYPGVRNGPRDSRIDHQRSQQNDHNTLGAKVEKKETMVCTVDEYFKQIIREEFSTNWSFR